MALDAAIVWEIRTTGNQNNSGGFKAGATGTDYSQQDAAEDSGTDLACADGDAASPEITSATHNFVAADVGNTVHITAGTGWTVGWYEIVSVSANAATMDRAVGTDGAKTNGTWYLGGAFKIGGALDADFFTATTGKVVGNTVHIEYGTYTLSESIAVGAQINIIGYSSTRGDEPTGDTRPTLDCGSSYFISGSNFNMSHLILTGSYAGAGAVLTPAGGAGLYVNLKISNTSTSANKEALRTGGNTFIGCEFISTLGYAVRANTASGRLVYCYIHDSKIGFYLDSQVYLIMGCVIDSCTTGIDGVTPGNNDMINLFINNTIYNCTTGVYTDASSVVLTQILINNIIDGCTTGVDMQGTATLPNYMDFNCWNNTTDITGSQFTKGDNTVSVDPEISAPATADFTISSESSASNTAMDASTYTAATV